MRDGPIGKTSNAKEGLGTDWVALRRRSEAEIRKGIEADAEACATDEEFWKKGRVVWPRGKAVVTMRLDRDLLEWFRRERGYQTRINAILRDYMTAHGSKS